STGFRSWPQMVLITTRAASLSRCSLATNLVIRSVGQSRRTSFSFLVTRNGSESEAVVRLLPGCRRRSSSLAATRQQDRSLLLINYQARRAQRSRHPELSMPTRALVMQVQVALPLSLTKRNAR